MRSGWINVNAILVDTNVLVYAYDRSEPDKQRRALAVLDWLVGKGAGVLSTQVLAEFYSATTRRLRVPLTPDQAAQRLDSFVQVWAILDITPRIVLEAVRGVQRYGFHSWDAQIWAAAKLNDVPVVFSEDFGAGSEIEGVRFVDPFASDFKLGDWGL
jgi:predicted nucleic acid-binding protein